MTYYLKEDAIFIADSHYNKKNLEFETILKKLEKQQIKASQIFLMGDNFDFLSYEIAYFRNINKDIVNLLNKLSNSYEIFYIEGNHDYNLKKVFPKIKVIEIEAQPLLLSFKDKKIAISHGDNFTNWHYKLFCKIIRNTVVLRFLNLIDINNFISRRIEENLLSKNICPKLDYFPSLVEKRLKNYTQDIVIEGHYHQGTRFKIDGKEYINIPSLCCSNSFTRFIDGEFIIEKLD